MFKQSPRRNQRSKGLKIKHVLQIGLLLGVCIWLLYQVKHSHDKKASFVDNALSSDTLQIENDVVKLGRKDLPRQKEGEIIRNGHQKEDEEEEENKNEEEEENKNEEEHNKLEDIETGGKEGEEDDLHRDELEKTEDEVNGKGDFDDKEVRDGGERNNDLKEHEDSQEDNKGEDNEKADEVSQKESEEGKEDGEENDENGDESLEKVSEESNGKELNEKNEVEENNENEVEENKENSENRNADNETENQVNENESEMKVEEGKSSEEKENEEKEKEESKVEKEKSEEHEPELEQREDNSEGRAEDKDGHIQQVVLSENQVQDGNDSHNQGAREENYKNDDASSAVVHETQLLNESDSEHSENTSGEVLMENTEKLETENENKGTGESNQENKDKHVAEQENNENNETEQENKEYHESEQDKENHEVGQESKENPEREQESKENHEAEQESKESRDSEQENRETNEVLLENKENNGAEQENKENNETGSENKDENTDLNQIESASIINETQSAEKNNTSYSFMDTTLDSAHNQNELNPVLDAALNHTEKVATNEKFDSSLTLTTAENQEPTNWNSTNDSGKVSYQVQTFSTNSSEGTENDDTSHHTGIGGNEVIELSNRVEKLESNEENHVDSAKEDLPSTFSENKQNENERTVDSRENPNADKISGGDEEASLNTNSGQEAGQHESGDSSLPEHENESREDLETLPESTIAGHKSEETTV